MKKFLSICMTLILLSGMAKAEVKEPSFIGEAVLLVNDSTAQKLDKEMAQYRHGISWSTNAWDATFLKIDSGKASVRVPNGSSPVIIVKAADNESDPMSIISIYKFDAKKNKRETMIHRSNQGTTGSSYNVTKNMVTFNGDRFGDKSYILELPKLAPGEYGIVVTNPNALDEKRTVVSCFAVDK